MNRVLHSATESSRMASFTQEWAVAVFLLLIVPAVSAQASQSDSLADVARQLRAQKQAQPQADPSQAQQVADQLSEDQNNGGAPGGFKTYNAGDYKLWVPAPYKVEGHDDAGIVLSGPMVGVKRPVVLVGTAIATHWRNNDAAFQDTATHFSRLYAQSAKCEKTTIAGQSAYRCALAAANLLGNQVSGNAVFVLGSSNIYPVFCVTPTGSQSRDTLNDPHAKYDAKLWARQRLDREDADSRKVWEQCDTVFQSIHLKPEPDRQRSAQTRGPATAPGTTQPEKSPSVSGAGPANAGSASPADTRPRPAQAAAILSTSAGQPQASTVPAGYKVHPFRYCNGPQQCWDASVLVPADAQLISSDCKRYVFETKVQGAAFLLLAGPARDDCDGSGASAPDLVRWKQLVAPESERAPGTASTISSQQTTLGGKPAVITTLGFKKGLADWMGKRAEVESNGIQVVVGCMAPRENFAEGDAICSTLLGSLRLP